MKRMLPAFVVLVALAAANPPAPDPAEAFHEIEVPWVPDLDAMVHAAAHNGTALIHAGPFGFMEAALEPGPSHPGGYTDLNGSWVSVPATTFQGTFSGVHDSWVVGRIEGNALGGAAWIDGVSISYTRADGYVRVSWSLEAQADQSV